ncbi:ABC transporter family substrate-binding protein [Streptomyces sp. NPDC058374]|uniref:ABC transporter family substrate-binding protein n=1 Tax=Streptomyces sp. NPDC058374 TaxID=3346466 RepID=UPI0036550EF2
MFPDGARRRSVALLTTGVLALPAVAACGASDEGNVPAASQDIEPASRDLVANGSTLTWAVDAVPGTLNAYQADADGATSQVAGAVLPALFTLDDRGRPQANPDYLESAEVVEREPRQVVVYRLNQKAVWSDGREVGAPDFAAQWRALRGKDPAYWTARNAGYDRIAKVERGKDDLEVQVTFDKPYAEWRSLFTPLYPKDVMGTPDAFNDSARVTLKNTAGPFSLKKVDRKAGDITLARNPRWWGDQPKLDQLVFRKVAPKDRTKALTEGRVDLAALTPGEAERISLARRDKGAKGPLAHGPGAGRTPADALMSWAVAHGTEQEAAQSEQLAREQTRSAITTYTAEQKSLAAYEVRKALEPAYTQLALNGADGPLADERVRRAVARALDRDELAETVLKPLELPAQPVGSHLALAGQDAYEDASGALGTQDTAEARALLAEAGWKPGEGASRPQNAGASGEPAEGGGEEAGAAENSGNEDRPGDDGGEYIVGEDDGKPGERGGPMLPRAVAAGQGAALLRQADVVQEDGDGKAEQGARAQQGGPPGAYAPKGTAAPNQSQSPGAEGAAGPLAKDGQPLTLRFVVPSGAGTEQLKAVADKIADQLEKIGVTTAMKKVPSSGYFTDHVASGSYDLALYSWPGTAYPATDGRPIHAKPVPAADGSLNVAQNYTRVGTDRIDQLFDQAVGELDDGARRKLIKEADARIWAVAGAIPLFQRPELVAARPRVANAGAFGFATPRYQDIGFLKKGVQPGAQDRESGS